MFLIILFAFLAGIVTILSPCILPLLPIVLSGTVSGGKRRPLGIITGFVASFTVFTLSLSALVQALGISPDLLRWIAAGVIIAFGLIMVIPPFKTVFMRLVSRLASRGMSAQQNISNKGFVSGLTLGVSLGLVWTPCVGPIMASVISLALSSTVDLGSVFITLSYSLGTAVPLFIIMRGGKSLMNRFSFFKKHSNTIQKVFGVLMLLTGLAILTGFDRQFQTSILTAFPGYGQGLTKIEDQGFINNAIAKRNNDLLKTTPTPEPGGNVSAGGTAPAAPTAKPARDTYEAQTHSLYDAITMGGPWINSAPINPSSLRGKVVLIDFWTYSCINCIRTLPYLTAWDKKYRGQGLVIIGVHSPEFAFEHETSNVKQAVKDFGIEYPVVQDNKFAIWRAFNNHYWPAHYFFNKSGELVSMHFGEGAYAESEQLIQKLLGESGPLAANEIKSTLSTTAGKTPETYLGYNRASSFASPDAGIQDTSHNYSLPSRLQKNQWALSGPWTQTAENIVARGGSTLELSFHAQKVYLVLGPADTGPAGEITVTVNGKAVNTADIKNGKLELKMYRLYELYNGDKPIDGLLRLKTTGPLKAYAFTFG
jgi:cytochrome c biogenesis protein CcdA/thiol-disulfide isomerase/thioredoxin